MTKKTDPKDLEAVKLAVQTVIENSDNPDYIKTTDVLELMGWEYPDGKNGMSWGSVSHVTQPITRTLAEMGYVKANVHEDGHSVVRWLNGQHAKNYLARKGRREYNRQRRSGKSSNAKRKQSRSGERSGRTKAARKKAYKLIRELKAAGFKNADIQLACGVGSGTVSRLFSPNPKYNYTTMEIGVLHRIEAGYDKLMGKRKTKRPAVKEKAVQVKPVKVNGHKKAVAENDGITLPRSILDSKDPLTVIKALVDTGQSVTISADG